MTEWTGKKWGLGKDGKGNQGPGFRRRDVGGYRNGLGEVQLLHFRKLRMSLPWLLIVEMYIVVPCGTILL